MYGKHKKLIYIIIFLLCIFWGATKIYAHIKSGDDQNKNNQIYVQTIVSRQQIVPNIYKTIATITAKNDVTLFYESTITGRVHKILKSAGSNVTQGDILISLLPESQIKAPINGIVTKWLLSPGEFVQKGKEIGRIIDNSELEAEYYVPEQFANLLKIGQKVFFNFRTFANKEFVGTVEYISPFSDTNNHSILVRASLNNTNKEILPGFFTNIKHVLDNNRSVLVIPDSCLIKEIDGYEVFKIIDNKAVKVKVEIGSKNKSIVEIKSGISIKDNIVLTIHPELLDGKEVEFKEFTGKW